MSKIKISLLIILKLNHSPQNIRRTNAHTYTNHYKLTVLRFNLMISMLYNYSPHSVLHVVIDVPCKTTTLKFTDKKRAKYLLHSENQVGNTIY